MVSTVRIVGILEFILISVILPLSIFSLWIAVSNISYFHSLFPRPFNILLWENYQSLLFGLLGIVTFVIGLVGVIKLRNKKILFSYVTFSLIIIWSLWTIIVAVLSLKEHSVIALEFTVSWEGIVLGIIMIISSVLCLFYLSKVKQTENMNK